VCAYIERLIGALTGLMFCGFPAHILAAGDLTAWLVWEDSIRSPQIKSIVSITARAETALRGWACEIRTQKCRRKLSL
jgi:hypothetical protein